MAQHEANLKTEDLLVRCMAQHDGTQWVAVCLDFSLAAQGSTLDEARLRLHEQIEAYVREAFTIDRQHAAQLLTRRAPLRDRIVYRVARLLSRLHSRSQRAYSEALPLCPAGA